MEYDRTRFAGRQTLGLDMRHIAQFLDRLENLLSGFSHIGIMAVGMAFPLLLGGIDLSVGAIMGLTVRDMDETLKYWNGVLAMEMPAPTKWEKDQAVLDLMGLPKGAEYRVSSGVISGSPAKIEFTEVKGVPRKPFDLRVTDANASGMALRVGHIRDLLAKIKASGGRVLSRNEELVEWSDTIRNVFVKDPNGLNLELVGSADPNQ